AEISAGRFALHRPDSQKTLIDYAIYVNPKISSPQRLIDTRIAYMLHRDSMFASKNVQKLRGNNGSREVIKTWNVRGAWVREKRRDSFESELVKMAHLLKA
ncbi:hypothetical protein WUBG_13511, partial [Wuchereria bancrofti]